MTANTLKFTSRDHSDFQLIMQIAKRAVSLERQLGNKPRSVRHHQMNVSACHASGNPLRLAELLNVDDFNFVHDVFGIDRHICRDTGALLDFFSPRCSARPSDYGLGFVPQVQS